MLDEEPKLAADRQVVFKRPAPRKRPERETRLVAGPLSAPRDRTPGELVELLERLRRDSDFRGLSLRAKWVLSAGVSAFGNGANEWWTTQQTWAEVAGTTRDTIRKAIAELELSGLVRVVDQKKKKQGWRKAPTHYVLHERFALDDTHRQGPGLHVSSLPLHRRAANTSDTWDQRHANQTSRDGLVGTGSQREPRNLSSSTRRYELDDHDNDSAFDYTSSHGRLRSDDGCLPGCENDCHANGCPNQGPL
jgi:hypothetical protein